LVAARSYRYDLAVQLHGGGSASNPLVSALGARWSIGLRAENAVALGATVPYRYYQSEVFRFLEVVALVGAQGSPEYPKLAVSAREQESLPSCCPPDGPGWRCTRVRVIHGGGGPRIGLPRSPTHSPPRVSALCLWGPAATCL
jgi:hypothetical protein